MADITGTSARDTLTGPTGADTVIDMGGGAQMVLVDVPMSSLTGAWIFES